MYCYEYIVATLSLRDTHVMLCNIMCSQDDYLCISECDIRDDEMTQISGSGDLRITGYYLHNDTPHYDDAYSKIHPTMYIPLWDILWSIQGQTRSSVASRRIP